MPDILREYLKTGKGRDSIGDVWDKLYAKDKRVNIGYLAAKSFDFDEMKEIKDI